MTSLLDMVKVMQFAISEGKVAIHCHAGKGKLFLYQNKILSVSGVSMLADVSELFLCSDHVQML